MAMDIQPIFGKKFEIISKSVFFLFEVLLMYLKLNKNTKNIFRNTGLYLLTCFLCVLTYFLRLEKTIEDI